MGIVVNVGNARTSRRIVAAHHTGSTVSLCLTAESSPTTPSIAISGKYGSLVAISRASEVNAYSVMSPPENTEPPELLAARNGSVPCIRITEINHGDATISVPAAITTELDTECRSLPNHRKKIAMLKARNQPVSRCVSTVRPERTAALNA